MSQVSNDPDVRVRAETGAHPVSRREAARREGAQRRVGRWYDAVSWLALVGFVVAVLGTSLLGRTTFFATDLIEIFDPWRSVDPAPSEALNGWVGDTVDTVGPSNHLAAESVRDGEFLQWNPYVVGGVPLLPVPDNGSLSPLTLPWYLVPAFYAPGLVKLLEIATVTVGMSLLGRRWGLRSGSWALGALAFASCGFMIAWTNWSQTRVAAFIPLLFWAVDRIADRSRVRDLVPVALVTGAMITGGFPAITGWALYFAAAHLVVRLLAIAPGWREAVGRLAIALAGVVAGLTLLAWQLVPFVNTTLSVVDFDAREQNGNELDWWAFAASVVPSVFGGPAKPDFPLNRNPIEAFSYIGAAALVVAVVGGLLRARSARTQGVAVAVYGGLGLSIVLTYLGGPLLAVAQMLPVFSNNPIGRLRVIVGFLAAVAVMWGFDAVMARAVGVPPGDPAVPPRSPRTALAWRWAGITAALALAALVLTGIFMVLDMIAPDLRAWAEAETWLALGIIGATILVVLLGVRPRRSGAVLVAVVVPVLIAVPASATARAWWPQASPEFFYAETPTHEFLRENLGHDRYATAGTTTLPGSSSAFRLRAATGHSFHSPAWKEALLHVDEDVMLSRTFSTLSAPALERSLTSPILDRMAVRYVVAGSLWLPPGEWHSLGSGSGVVEVAEGEPFVGSIAGPFRSIAFNLAEGMDVGDDGGEVLVTVTAGDEVVAEVRQVVERSFTAAGLAVRVPADTLRPGERVDVAVTFSGVETPVKAMTYGRTGLLGAVLRPVDDDFTLVAAGEAQIIERTGALPRIRWASDSVTEPDGAARLAALASETLPDDTVVLSERTTWSGSGLPAGVDILEDEGDHIRVRVDAEGAGWLVVADNLLGVDGWEAALDGRPVGIAAADHVGGAVEVPEGVHEVTLRYRSPGLQAGLGGTALTALVLIGIQVAGRRRDRLARLTH